MTQRRVIQLITRCHDDYRRIKKILMSKTTNQKTKDEKLASFMKQMLTLFDIAFCKCADFSKCTCPKDKKVPVLERQFLLDQRGPRIGRIGSIDVPVTKKLIKRAERSCKMIKPEISVSESSDHGGRNIRRGHAYSPLWARSEATAAMLVGAAVSEAAVSSNGRRVVFDRIFRKHD